MNRLLAAAAALTALAAAPRPAPPPQPVFPYGVSWYPEQFPESQWAGELDLMQQAHVSFVRVAEFAWSTLEPREGQYDFAWLDRAVALAGARGIKVVIGTPTAAPPAWLTTKYPEVLAVEASGRPVDHGWRRHFSVASPLYRRQAAAIAAKLAARYGHAANVIGFQIDNEYGRDTYDAEMLRRFQDWMKARYGSLDTLNRLQGNSYWSLTYDDWRQLRIPVTRAQPALWLAWLRFFTDIWIEYQQNQIDAIRPLIGADKLITTNLVSKYDEFDFGAAAQPLDVAGWDWYFDEPVMIPADGAMQHDLYRGFLKRGPWVMETAAGTQNGASPSYFQLKGETRAMAWQAIGHGADGYAYWLWRSPVNGTETAHGSLVDVDGRPRPIFAEIAAAGGEIARAWPQLRGTTPVVNAAMIYDYPNRWAIERQPLTPNYDVWKLFVQYRAALAPVTAGVDVLRGADDLGKYPLVVAPNLYMMSPATTAKLLAYVRGGGHLLLGPRAGTKDEELNLTHGGPMGPLAAALGVQVDMSQPPIAPIAMAGPLGPATDAVWADRVSVEAGDVETLLRYGPSDGWLDGAAAVVTRAVGKGRITYVGAWLDDAATARLVAWAAGRAGVAPLWPGIPPGVEVDARAAPGRTVYTAINWAATPATVALPRPMRDLVGGAVVTTVTLPRFDVAVLGEAR